MFHIYGKGICRSMRRILPLESTMLGDTYNVYYQHLCASAEHEVR